MSQDDASADGWLFVAVMMAAHSQDPRLTDIIEVGDAINHAIFSLDELNGGFGRFRKLGLLTVNGDRFHPTDVAQDAYVQVKRGNWLDTIRAAGAWLSTHGLPSAEPEHPRDFVTREEFDRAFADYRVRFNQALQRIERRERDKGPHD